MHEICVVGQGHLLGVNCPVAVGAEDLSVVGAAVGRPVPRIDEVGAPEGLALVVFYLCAADKSSSYPSGWVITNS